VLKRGLSDTELPRVQTRFFSWPLRADHSTPFSKTPHPNSRPTNSNTLPKPDRPSSIINPKSDTLFFPSFIDSAMVDPVRHPRVIFIGDSNVGKSSLIHRARYNDFNDGTPPTIGAGVTTMATVHQGVEINYQLLDTAGQELYRSIVPLYFRGVCGAVLVFSILEESSFNNLPAWREEIAKHGAGEIPVVVVGNKVDCPEREWRVSQSGAREWAELQKLPLIFTSASTGERVALLLNHIVFSFVVPSLGVPSEFLTVQTEADGCC
jgi:small GTP-binding protein